MELQPIKRQSLSQAVFDQLRGQILGGEMPPGTPLPSERKLCEMLGVNRGAVREALKRLEQAQLVSIQQGGVTRVADYNESGGLELLPDLLFPQRGQVNTDVARGVMHMRSILAPDAARLAAQHASPEIKEELTAVVSRLEQTGDDLAERQRVVIHFWDLIIAGSGNVAYRLANNTLRDVYARVFEALTNVLGPEFADQKSYAAIARAIAAGEADKAERQTRKLVDKGAQLLGRVLDSLDEVNGEG